MTQRPFVDFGRSAEDYARHRPGFPDSFFEHVAGLGIGVAGQRMLDLGAGTGTLARGFAQRGCRVTALDVSAEMLRATARLAGAAGLEVTCVRARAEALCLAGSIFDVVTAGQCWHWLDGPQAAREAARVLRPGGRALIAYFTYLTGPSSLGALTDERVMRHNPGWGFALCEGRFPSSLQDLAQAGFEAVEEFEFDADILFSHESWRGRFRACSGVLQLPPEGMAAFDAELAALLARRFPEPLHVPHRIYGVVGTKTGRPEEAAR